MGNGTPLVITIDALTSFLCTAVLLLVHVPSPTRSDLTTGGRIEQSLWADVREGAIYIRHQAPENIPRIIGCSARMFFLNTCPASP